MIEAAQPAPCPCGHTTGERCPDCGAAICEECATVERLLLFGREDEMRLAEEYWLFCERCAFYEAVHYLALTRWLERGAPLTEE